MKNFEKLAADLYSFAKESSKTNNQHEQRLWLKTHEDKAIQMLFSGYSRTSRRTKLLVYAIAAGLSRGETDALLLEYRRECLCVRNIADILIMRALDKEYSVNQLCELFDRVRTYTDEIPGYSAMNGKELTIKSIKDYIDFCQIHLKNADDSILLTSELQNLYDLSICLDDDGFIDMMLFNFGDTPAATIFLNWNDDEENFDSPDWKIFIETLETGIESLATRRENEPLDLEKCLNVICDGCEKSDPIMLFLGARFADYASMANEYLFGDRHIHIAFSRKLKSFSYQHDFPFLNDDEVKDLYICAAEAGSLHALLWCAWCYAEGQGLFAANQEKAKDYIKKASILCNIEREQLHLIDYLRMKELADLFAVELEWLDDHAHDIDIEEDYNDCFGLTLPDPSWRVLCKRIDYLETFARTLGVTTEVFFKSIYSNARCYFAEYNSETELTWIAWSLNELKTNITPTVDSTSETDDVKTVKCECGTSFVDSNPATCTDLAENMTESSVAEEKEE